MDELGNLERAGDLWRLRFVRHLPHPVEKVWRAVTEPEHLGAWFPSTIEGERAPGAALRFVFDGGFVVDGEMLVYDPPRCLEFTWGEDTLRIELAPDGEGTRLTLLDSFPEQGKAARDAAGWHVCLELLALATAGQPGLGDHRARWAAVHPRYVEAFGPDAATGPPSTA